MKLAIATIIAALALSAAPQKFVREAASVNEYQIQSVYTPIGIWPLCLMGLSLPGCYAGMPQAWMDTVYVEDSDGNIIRVISQTVL